MKHKCLNTYKLNKHEHQFHVVFNLYGTILYNMSTFYFNDDS